MFVFRDYAQYTNWPTFGCRGTGYHWEDDAGVGANVLIQPMNGGTCNHQYDSGSLGGLYAPLQDVSSWEASYACIWFGCRIGYYHYYGLHSPGKSNVFGGTYLPGWNTKSGLMLMYTREELPEPDIGCQSST